MQLEQVREQARELLQEHTAKVAIGAAVLLLGLGCFMFWPSGGAADQIQSGKVQYVCVETGEVFWFPRGEPRTPPCENPKTGAATLMLAHENSDGELLVSDLGGTLEKLGSRNKWVDPDSLKVRPPKS